VISRKTNQNEIEERGLINLDKFSIPGLEFILGRLFIGAIGLNVLLAVLDDLGENLACDVGKRDPTVGAIVLYHMLYRLRLESDNLIHFEGLTIGTLERDLLCRCHSQIPNPNPFFSLFRAILFLKRNAIGENKRVVCPLFMALFCGPHPNVVESHRFVTIIHWLNGIFHFTNFYFLQHFKFKFQIMKLFYVKNYFLKCI